MLLGRESEVEIIDRLLARARDGHSGSLVLRGEAGIGKSALLEYAASKAGDMRVLRGTGVEPERDLPFAGLHLLLRNDLDRVEQLPCAQRGALSAAFGLAYPDKEDLDPGSVRFVAGLAVLTLLADLAEDQPLLCLLDDAHWLDYESAEALLFAARRLEAEGVVILFSARELHAPRFPASGVDDLRVSGLDTEAAAELLAKDAGDLPGYVRQQILSQSDGNPLALRELAIAQREGQLSHDPYGIGRLPTHSRILRTFADRVAALPPSTQDAILVAATAGSCDSGVILDTAEKLGATAEDLEMAERKDLVIINAGTLLFRHPLIRAAVYQYAPLNRRTQAHLALAETFASRADADRRAWHLAAAATGPSEEIAAALEESAEQSRTRGSYSAVAAAYERAAWLSLESKHRSRRLLAAAQAALEAGQLDRADTLSGQSGDQYQDPARLVDRAMVRATTASWRGSPSAAHQIWVDAAVAVADRVPDYASYMLFHAVEAAWIAADFDAVRRSAELAEEWGLPRADRVRAMARIVAGMNNHADGSMSEAAAAIRHLMQVTCAVELSPQAAVRVVWWMLMMGDHSSARIMVEPLIKQCRETGAMGVLPRALGLLAKVQLYSGEHRDAVATASEALRIASDMGKNLILVGVPVSVMAQIAAIEGDQEYCHELVTNADPGMKYGLIVLEGMLALLDMGLGRYEAVVQRLKPLVAGDHAMDVLPVVPDLIEAAVRIGTPDIARAPMDWFGQFADHSDQPWARGVAARCEALLADDSEAEALFLRALEAHKARSARPFEQARTELLYGEWLRRNRRRVDARVQLRAAMVTFERMGAKPWVDRTDTELRATGESPYHKDVDRNGLLERLTPQELQVVRLAATGMTNRDIGGQLFLSPRTVGYHLYKAYPKLGVSSRGELARLDLSA